MRAKLNNIIVQADMEQNEKHTITCNDGKKITLYIGRQYNFNHREKNPCVCTVIHNPNENYPHIKEGDVLVLHYGTFENPNYLIEKDGSVATFSIPLFSKEFNNKTQEYEWNINHYIFGKIIDGEIHPLCDNLICERIVVPQESEIIFNPIEKTYKDRVKCLRVSPEIDYLKSGDTLLMHKMSDYEVVYHIDNREHRAIKLWRNDVIGVIHE